MQTRQLRFCALALFTLTVLGCPPEQPDKRTIDHNVATSTQTTHTQPPSTALASVKPETAPAPAGMLSAGEAQQSLSSYIDFHFARHSSMRGYIQLDKPMYQPGETIWFRSTLVNSANMSATSQQGVLYELISPKGASVLSKRVLQQDGIAYNDFEIPDTVQGGEYKLRASCDDGTREERSVIVNTYEAPRFKKKLDFVRKAYGAGDLVAANVEIKLATNEAFAGQNIVAVLTLDGVELPRVTTRTDDKGASVVRVQLPRQIEVGDGILTIMVDSDGITESITKRVPIVINKLKFAFFPEGGDLVAGLPTRVYFAAHTMIDKPADVEGKIVDDHGQVMASFRSFHDGMGRFELTPATGRTYFAEIKKPIGVVERYQLPLASESGCTLRSFDDPKGELAHIRAAINCSQAQTVLLTAVLREQRLGSATADVSVGKASVVYLPLSQPLAQGVARLTLFSADHEPLAERLLYRAWHRDLNIKINADKESYAPRNKVLLNIETTDQDGAPVAANLAMAVVDDTVLSFADDKTAHVLTHMLLEKDLPGKIEEPNFYFDIKKEKAPQALDMLLGTRGWRRFEWQPVLAAARQAMLDPHDDERTVDGTGTALGGRKGVGQLRVVNENKAKFERPAAEMEQRKPRPVAPAVKEKGLALRLREKPLADKKEQAAPKRDDVLRQVAVNKPVAKARRAERVLDLQDKAFADEEIEALAPAPVMEAPAGRTVAMDEDWGEAIAAREPQLEWAKVRVFPVIEYTTTHEGPRTDFRETIYWNPEVKTDSSGKTQLSFYLSDAVTSFRITSEGFSANGVIGRDETTVASKLPFFMSVKLPLEVSAGDMLNLPLTLKNEQGQAMNIALSTRFGEQVKLLENVAPGTLELSANSGRTMSYPLEVVGNKGACDISFKATAAGLGDEFTRTLKVVPLGFPRTISSSGQLTRGAKHQFKLAGALDGSIVAAATFYPSPTAEMLSGVDSILQEPCGCFEQASSSNYPNIMVMRYLQEHDIAAPELLTRSSRLLDNGYKKLIGYESPKRGYEWFGGNPGHEALTAYGLMEFVDMQKVYSDVDSSMIARTRDWLLARRDGKGGFLRNDRALDSFGSASKEVTDAYILWALSEARVRGLDKELRAVATTAQASNDPYIVALATCAQFNVDTQASTGRLLAQKLVAMQDKDGKFGGANHSITRSGGRSLDVETTALAVLALLKSGAYRPNVNQAVKWLSSARSGSGGFGSTQGTILALRALVEYDRSMRRTEAGGEIQVVVNGERLPAVRFEKGRQEPIVIEGLAQALKPGENNIELMLNSTAPLPYAINIDYRTNAPETSPQAPFTLSTKLARDVVKMAETVRVTTKLESTVDTGLPMTLVRVGIPGGMTYQTWQLKELVDKKLVDFYETRAREVIFYFRALEPRAKREISVDLVANVPGQYTAPASSAYLYYTAEHKVWATPLKARIDS